jgi:subtilisin family serine protease
VNLAASGRARSPLVSMLAVACALSLLLGSQSSAAAGAADSPSHVSAPVDRGALLTTEETPSDATGSLIVTTRSPAALRRLIRAGAADRALQDADVSTLGTRILHVTAPPAAADATRAALLAHPDVLAVEEDRTRWYAAVPNDERYVEQWSHQVSGAEAAWDITTGGPDVRIAVIDSGIDAAHPDLAGQVVRQVDVSVPPGFREGAQDASSCRGTVAEHHGTAVAGIAAAAGNNGIGIAGAAWQAAVIDIQMSSSDGGCDPSDGKIIRGLAFVQAHEPRIDVVNLSLGGYEPGGVCPVAMQAAIDDVRARGTVVVAAAGNDGGAGFQVPAGCRGVIAVAAAGRDGQRASYSSTAGYVDVAGPGGELGDGVLSTARGGGYQRFSGTSFAAPYVSGVVALMRTMSSALSPDEVEAILEATSVHPLGAGVYDDLLGWGNIRASGALNAVQRGVRPVLREHPVLRVSPRTGQTDPVGQAVAVSRRVFVDRTAAWGLIARSDDFADALAGSSLAYGVAPMLFTPPQGGLPAATRAELRRAVRPGSPVYVLGGRAAVDPLVDEELRTLGFQPVRLDGPTREETAVAVARQLRRVLPADQRGAAVIIATRGNWPDAVAAGSLGAIFGVPILLTPPDALHGSTADYLQELRAAPDPVQAVYVIGGTAAVSHAAAQQSASVAGLPDVHRLGGAARDLTALAVAREVEALLRGFQVDPAYAVAIDLDRPDSFAHALSASVIAGNTLSLFVPVRGPTAPPPGRLTQETAAYACNLAGRGLLAGSDGLLAGDVDLLPETLGRELNDILAGRSPRC